MRRISHDGTDSPRIIRRCPLDVWISVMPALHEYVELFDGRSIRLILPSVVTTVEVAVRAERQIVDIANTFRPDLDIAAIGTDAHDRIVVWRWARGAVLPRSERYVEVTLLIEDELIVLMPAGLPSRNDRLREIGNAIPVVVAKDGDGPARGDVERIALPGETHGHGEPVGEYGYLVDSAVAVVIVQRLDLAGRDLGDVEFPVRPPGHSAG